MHPASYGTILATLISLSVFLPILGVQTNEGIQNINDELEPSETNILTKIPNTDFTHLENPTFYGAGFGSSDALPPAPAPNLNTNNFGPSGNGFGSISGLNPARPGAAAPGNTNQNGSASNSFYGPFQGACTECKSLAQCAPFYRTTDYALPPCITADSGPGVCCPEVTPKPMKSQPFPSFEPAPSQVGFPKKAIESTRPDANRFVKLRDEFLASLANRTILGGPTIPNHGGGLIGVRSSDEAIVGNNARQFLAATYSLRDRYGLSLVEAAYGTRSISGYGTSFEKFCAPQPICNKASKYRTIDGTCNNLKRPTMGRRALALQRILPPRYADGVYEPRRAIDGSSLPNPRIVSVLTIPNLHRPSRDITTTFMNFGTYISAESLNFAIPIYGYAFNAGPCCTPDGSRILPKDKRHPSCHPIEIPSDDPFFGQYGRQCMAFFRLEPGLRGNCRNFGYVDPLSLNTQWNDASPIYGSHKKVAFGLRTGYGGALRGQPSVGQPPLLPPEDLNDESFVCPQCFSSGDGRVNIIPGSIAMGTVFTRQHNSFVRELQILNPQWTDEDLYQEGRRIIGAILQHILYNEFLPILLGLDQMERKGLIPLSRGHQPPNHYQPDVDATVTVAFGAAAFRLHSLIQDSDKFIDKRFDVVEEVLLRRTFFNPVILNRPGLLDDLIRGMINQSMETYDNVYTKEMTSLVLSPIPSVSAAFDLFSTDIHRGRELGVRGYNEWRALCGLKRAKKFRDFADIIPEKIVERFKWLYKHPDDVDLLIGLVSETHEDKVLVGPTTRCILADSFQRLKVGDRYWYELGGQPHSFNEAQLREIRKISLARILCDNSGEVEFVQRLPFWKFDNSSNPLVDCKGPEIPRMSLLPWKGELVASQTNDTSQFFQPETYASSYEAANGGNTYNIPGRINEKDDEAAVEEESEADVEDEISDNAENRT